MKDIPFRIGTTSYIIPADILPNVNYLAGKVQDVELVLFEVDDGPNNLPDEDTIAQLKRAAALEDLTYTVHLPLDLKLGGAEGERQSSIRKAIQVIDNTKALRPFAYVLHLDGRKIRSEFRSQRWREWTARTRDGLTELVDLMDDPALLAVENLDGYPPDFWDETLAGMPVSRCVDVGHLWRDGHDPLSYLQEHIRRTRVIHIHGVAERDHKSLAHVPPQELQAVLQLLLDADYQGVLTLEIFGEEDFTSSMGALHGIFEKNNWRFYG
jgi:sugar phosphate isomerase/epimerase